MPPPHGHGHHHHGGGGGRRGGGGWGWGPGWGPYYPWWPDTYYEPVILVDSGASVLPDQTLKTVPAVDILGRRIV